jgi:hypothetical protein
LARGRQWRPTGSVWRAESVGDSHEGPLNNQRNLAKTRKKQTQTNLNTHAKQTHRPTAHETIGLATLGRNSAPLEGYNTAPVQLHLARGPVTPSGEVPSRSRVGRPLERDSASLGAWTPPSHEAPSRSRAEGPLERVSASLEGITGPSPPYLLFRQGHLMH